VKLTALRLHDEELRARLRAVREALESAVRAIEAGDRAEAQLAAARDRRAGQGAYRDVAAERASEWQSDVDAAVGARERRERLRVEEASLLDELEQTRRDIERAGVKSSAVRALALAPDATRCEVRWDQMTGDGDARTCPRCKSAVLSVAMLEPADAEALLASVGPNASFHRRHDGTILPRDCPVAAERTATWRAAPVSIAVGFFVTMALVFLVIGLTTVKRKPAPIPIGYTAPPPSDPPADDGVLRVRDSSMIIIDDSSAGLAGTTNVESVLRRNGDDYGYKTTCNTDWSHPATGTIGASVVKTFLDAVQATPQNGASTPCGRAGDDRKVRVQFLSPRGRFEAQVASCSAAYVALRAAFEGDACARRRPIDPAPLRHPTPPVDTDGVLPRSIDR